MKQNLKIGNMVDDGSGDYLRQGGLKINENFDDLYYQLGDGKNPHAAGAWKTYKTSDGVVLDAQFGHSYAIDTSDGRVTVNMPKGGVAEYNFVVRLRDVFSTWQLNPITIVPAIGDTIKGSSDPVEINRNLADLEMVYCAPGRWEYIDNKQVDRISNNDIATVATQEYIASEGQTDFSDIFQGHDYNVANLKVYHRGNLLFYGHDNTFDEVNAEFGSPGASPGEIVKLDGKNIRLKNACKAGDTVIVVSYMDGLGQWRSSYNRRQIRILDSRLTNKESIDGSIIVADLSTKKEFTIAELGVNSSSPVNPNASELYVNSILQYQAGTVGLPQYRCEGADGETASICTLNGGNWIESATDYLFVLDDDSIHIKSVKFDREFEHGDVITLVWYNNNIGTTLELDEIITNTDERYVAAGQTLTINGQVRITDYNNPFWPNVEAVPSYEVKPSAVASIFDLFHPVGTIYENTVNPNNPRDYMGFGFWKRMEDRVTVAWSSVAGSRFNLNNNDLDSLGNPSATAGGTGGVTSVDLAPENIPHLKTDDKVLVADDNGPIVIGGCQFDPDSQGPAYTKYREDQATINKIFDPVAQGVDTMNPYITVYRWMRIS